MELHHYGFATSNIADCLEAYKALGYEATTNIIEDKIQNVRLLFLKRPGEALIELVEPIDERSPVSAILKKSGPTLYHICYEVEDIAQSISELRAKKYLVVVKPVPAIAFNNRLISFLYHKHTGLIELLEKEK